jgi:uncharacterized membrane-anchored protein
MEGTRYPRILFVLSLSLIVTGLIIAFGVPGFLALFIFGIKWFGSNAAMVFATLGILILVAGCLLCVKVVVSLREKPDNVAAIFERGEKSYIGVTGITSGSVDVFI